MAKAKVQLEFHNTNGLTGNEAEIAEKMGMLLLASDFIGSSTVNKARDLDRISKAYITFLLSRTKSGDYLAINPFSSRPLKVKLTQLPSLSSITEFVTNPKNLSLGSIRNKLTKFETKETEILGAFNKSEIDIISQFLMAPKGDRSDFEQLRPTRDQGQIKEDIAAVNSLVYDQKSLDKEIDERINIIDKALKEQVQFVENQYNEREKYWKSEIDNKNDLLQKRLKEREAQLDKEIKGLEDKVDKDIDKNLQKFKDGVAKNIRKDEKPLEKSIVELEKLVGQKTDRNMVDKIENELIKLEDFTKIFQEAVGFARRQVDQVKGKERDIYELKELDIENFRQQAEIDKEQLRKDSKRKEKERDEEMKTLKASRDNMKQQYAEFRDAREEWKKEIRDTIGSQKTAMVPRSIVPGSDAEKPPSLVELQIPTYIFQYRKDTETYSLAVPPVQMPGNMRKPERGSFYGDEKTVYYNLIVPDSRQIITNWFQEASADLQLQSNIQELKNYLDNSADLRNTFFENSSLMVDKLKVDKNNFKKANNRLTEVFTSG